MFPKAVRKKSNNLEKFLLKTGKTNFCQKYKNVSWSIGLVETKSSPPQSHLP